MIIFGLLALLTWLLQRNIQILPHLVYTFVDSYGIALIFDFLLIALADIIAFVI